MKKPVVVWADVWLYAGEVNLSEKIEASQFGWGDVVRIASDAPSRLRPGDLGAVVGGWRVATAELAKEFGEPVGQLLLTIEYSDGSDAQVPPRYLELVEEGP